MNPRGAILTEALRELEYPAVFSFHVLECISGNGCHGRIPDHDSPGRIQNKHAVADGFQQPLEQFILLDRLLDIFHNRFFLCLDDSVAQLVALPRLVSTISGDLQSVNLGPPWHQSTKPTFFKLLY